MTAAARPPARCTRRRPGPGQDGNPARAAGTGNGLELGTPRLPAPPAQNADHVTAILGAGGIVPEILHCPPIQRASLPGPTNDSGWEHVPVQLRLLGDLPWPRPYAVLAASAMAPLSHRARHRLYSLILLAIVLLSWGYVIYASRIAAQWQLEKDYPTQWLNL